MVLLKIWNFVTWSEHDVWNVFLSLSEYFSYLMNCKLNQLSLPKKLFFKQWLFVRSCYWKKKQKIYNCMWILPWCVFNSLTCLTGNPAWRCWSSFWYSKVFKFSKIDCGCYKTVKLVKNVIIVINRVSNLVRCIISFNAGSGKVLWH